MKKIIRSTRSLASLKKQEKRLGAVMFSKFFKENILPFLIENDKDFISYTSDLMIVSFMIDKERDTSTPEIQKFYLGEIFFNYKMTLKEIKYTLDIFKSHIVNHTKYDLFCVSVLGKYPDKSDYDFLFEQLKRYITVDTLLAVELLKACINYTVDNEFIIFLKEQLNNDMLQKELKKYIIDIIDFYEHKTTVLDDPIVYYDNTGNNRYIKWKL